MLAANAWVEPMRQWLKQAYDLNRIAKSAEPSAIKQAFAEIEGLNLFLENKKARLSPRPISPLKNPWLALRAAKEKAPQRGDNFLKTRFLVLGAGLEPARPFGLQILSLVCLPSSTTRA